jgi:hypothetical protein
MSLVLILFVLARIFSRPRGRKGGTRRGDSRPVEDDLMARMFVPVPIEESTDT